MDMDPGPITQFSDLLTIISPNSTPKTPAFSERRTSTTSSISSSGDSIENTITPSSSNTPTKSKRRYTEKRRQQALLASRTRRGAESTLFQDLGQALPVTKEILKTMDKLAVLRVAVAYSKLRGVLKHLKLGESSILESEATSSKLTTMAVGDFSDGELESLLRDGFLIIMSTNGEIIYVSDNVSRCLRCDKHSVLGTNIYDHIQVNDRPELDKLLSIECVSQIVPARVHNSNSISGCSFKTPRDSAIVQLRGSVQGPGAGAVKISGKVFLNSAAGRCLKSSLENFFLGVIEPLTQLNPLDFDFPFPLFTVNAVLDWVCTADMKCVSYDMKMGHCAAYDSHELKGVSVFELMHAEDMAYVREGLKWMYKYGKVQSPQGYRMLIKNGGWAWFVTQASTMQVQMREQDGSLKTTTFCGGRHFMISEVFEPDYVMSPIQLRGGLPVPTHAGGLAIEDSGDIGEEVIVMEGPAIPLNEPVQEAGLNLQAPSGAVIDMDVDLGLGILNEDDWLQELGNWAEEGPSWSTEPVSVFDGSLIHDYEGPPPLPIVNLNQPATPTATPPSTPRHEESGGFGVRSQFPQLTSLLQMR